MKVDDPHAFRYIMEEVIYLLDKDKVVIKNQSAANASPLVDVPNAGTPGVTFNYMGGNNKRFLILVNYVTEGFMAPVHLSALENILKRKETAIDDVAILNLHAYPDTSIQELTAYFDPLKILIAGKNALPAGMNELKLNELLKKEHYIALYSFSFEEMMDNNDHKRIFWEQMKKL